MRKTKTLLVRLSNANLRDNSGALRIATGADDDIILRHFGRSVAGEDEKERETVDRGPLELVSQRNVADWEFKSSSATAESPSSDWNPHQVLGTHTFRVN
jgi:hypothetical protein